MKETPFKNRVEEWLNQNHHWYIKYWAGARYTKEGIPDILACINGRFVGMELKGTGGRPKLLQLKKLKQIREAGGIGVLLYPEDFEYFKDLLLGTEIGKHWYWENKQKQQAWFDKLNNV